MRRIVTTNVSYQLCALGERQHGLLVIQLEWQRAACQLIGKRQQYVTLCKGSQLYTTYYNMYSCV